jgi:hypothetical protein
VLVRIHAAILATRHIEDEVYEQNHSTLSKFGPVTDGKESDSAWSSSLLSLTSTQLHSNRFRCTCALVAMACNLEIALRSDHPRIARIEQKSSHFIFTDAGMSCPISFPQALFSDVLVCNAHALRSTGCC